MQQDLKLREADEVGKVATFPAPVGLSANEEKGDSGNELFRD